VQVHTVGIFNPPRNRKAIQMDEERTGLALLEDLSRATGGLHFNVNGTADIARVADRIGEALHNVYVIGYRPPAGVEGYRKVQVKATVPNVHLTARPGYYAARSDAVRERGILRP
jgi:VWFA-related protein